MRRASISPPVAGECVPTISDIEPTARSNAADTGGLSPSSVSAAEVLSRFRSSAGPLRFLENEVKEEEVEERETGTGGGRMNRRVSQP